MSEKTEVTEKKANERPKFGPGARRGPGGGGPGGHMVAGEKAVNFLPSVKRLMGNLRPVRALVIIAIAIGTLSVAAVLMYQAEWSALSLAVCALKQHN